MKASYVMAMAVGLYIIARWARNEPAFSVKVVAAGAFAILVIAALDTGPTEEIAQGFAWLFAVVAGYKAIGPIATAAGVRTGGGSSTNPPVKGA